MTTLVMLLFFLSGVCGLVYEVVWARMMTHVFGSTALAVGTVLAAFMCGLAVGSWRLGRLADGDRSPLRVYAYLECGVAVTALAAHLLLDRIAPAYLALYETFGRSAAVLAIARFVLAFVLVMAPTVLMGATLPVLARFVVRRLSGLGPGLSALYAINTAGAVAGALAAGFYLIGKLGIHATVYVAVLGNAAIGALAWLASQLPDTRPAESAPRAGARPSRRQKVDGRTYRIVLLGLGISGLASFAYEIYWTRSLVFLLGNSTYAVTSMLVAFLIGIALGGYLIRFLVDRAGDRVTLFGSLQILTGVTAAAALPVLFSLVEPHAIRAQLWEATLGARALTPLRFAIALPLMLVPAMLIGATFPLVGRIGVATLERTGTDVGRIYAVNTLGNVAGALLPGLALLHWLGIQRGIVAMAALNVAVGVTVLVLRLRHVPSLRWVLPAVVVAAALVLARLPLDLQFPSEEQGAWHRVLYYRDGPSATTAVLLDPDTGEKTMSVDGVDIGGSGATDYKQQILAHLPKLLLDDVSGELSVGFGSGILAGESARHERVRTIDCVEIEPTVVEGARQFAAENHGVADDARVRIIVDDVTNHLRTTRERYRVVSADEKTAQEYASNGFSYSREYYEMIRSRLASGGLMIQWVPTSLPPRLYRMVLKTFGEAFPHVLVWYFAPAFQSAADNTLLVGSNERILPNLGRMRRWLASDSTAFAGLSRYGFTTAEAVLAQLVTDGEALRPALAGEHENTVAHPRYEFYSPRDYAVPAKQRFAANLELLMDLRRRAAPRFAAAFSPPGARDDRLTETVSAEDAFLAGYGEVLAHAPPAEAASRFGAALALAPWNASLRVRILSQYWHLSQRYSGAGDYRTAAALMERGLAAYGERALNWVEYALVLRALRETDGAIAAARRAVTLDPELIAGHRVLAETLLATGRRDEAREHLRAVLAIDPHDTEARRLLTGF
jgi:spermidine synthase